MKNEDLRGRIEVDDINEHISRTKWRLTGQARLKDERFNSETIQFWMFK